MPKTFKPELILQQKNTRVCGQCCVAMATGITLRESIAVFGRGWSTTTKDVKTALTKLKIGHNKLQRVKDGTVPVSRAIVRLHWEKVIKGKHSLSHWVLLWDGHIYCSIGGINPDWSAFPDVRYTSYIEILK